MSETQDGVFMMERAMHYILMGLMIGVIAFAVLFAYHSIGIRAGVDKALILDEVFIEGDGTTKPLPDFMIDDVKPDELEILKP